MLPIVNRLEADYSGRVDVLSLDVENEGAELFRQLGLPGHPSYVLFASESQEIYRTFGVVEIETLQAAIDSHLDSE